MNTVNLLLVDDVEENLVALEAVLRPVGACHLKASSGPDALELLLNNEVALALVDVQMPGMDGFELAEYMRGTERTRGIPILFLTAGRDPARVFEGYEAGAVDFLQKPLDPNVLLSKVKVFIELFLQRRQLASQVRVLEESLRMNEFFMAVLGHDLRSPLNALSMSAELLVRDPTNVDRVLANARRIRDSAKRMTRMVTDLTETARARSGHGIPITRSECDLAELCKRAVEEQETQGGNVSFELRGDVRGAWDAGRLSQLLTNLLSNALEHGERGRPVRLELVGSTETVRLSVHNGGHIPEELQASVFEPFRTTRASGQGLGLGLFIVRQIVEAHDGTLQLESSPAHGTTFRVELPRAISS